MKAKQLSLLLAVIAVAIGIAAPAAFAKQQQRGNCQCLPGSSAAEYCQHDPGHGKGKGDDGHDDHGRRGHGARHGR